MLFSLLKDANTAVVREQHVVDILALPRVVVVVVSSPYFSGKEKMSTEKKRREKRKEERKERERCVCVCVCVSQS